MKKTLSLILCLMIMLCVSGISIADDALPPSVKIQRQMQNDGNGIKGSFRFEGNVAADGNPVIAALLNADFDLLRNASGEKWHLVVFQQDEKGQQISKTEVYGEETGTYLRSDFIPEQVLRIPAAEELIPDSMNGAGENPSIISVLGSVMSMNDAEKARWDPVLQKYSAMVETWLAGYAVSPEMQRNPDGTVVMKLIYAVPADDVRSEITSLMLAAASDPEAASLLEPLLTSEQRSVYLNAGLGEYYAEAMKGINLSGEMRFEKDVSTLGEMIASEISLPLDPAITGYHTLDIFTRDGQTGFTLTGDGTVLRLVVPDGMTELTGQSGFEGEGVLVSCSRAEDRKDSNLALRINIRKTFTTYTDDEAGRIHEIHHFTVSAVRDEQLLPDDIRDAEIPEFEPVSIDADFHFSSKAPQSSPVTLDTAVSYNRSGTSLMITGKVKTAATWPFVPFSIENAKPLNGMTPEGTGTLLTQWVRNASGGIKHTSSEGEAAE